MGQKPANKYVLLIFAGLVLATAGVYCQVHGFEFVNLDDPGYVTENRHVVNGLNIKNFVWAFTSFELSNWHPLTWLSLMLDCHLSDAKSQSCHTTNILFHIANTLLLFWVFKKMTGCLWRSAFVAALFALHPLHVESVAWVSERKDVLSTFFWLLTTWAYIRYTEHKGFGKYALVLVFFILGLMSKPMLVTLPFVLLLLDYWPLGRLRLSKLEDIRKTAIPLVIEKIPLFILVAASCVITYIAQKYGGAVMSGGYFPFKLRIFNALVSYNSYIGKMVWPVELSMFYPYKSVTVTQVAQAGLCLIIVSAISIRWRERLPYLLVGWFWFLGTLIPVIGLVQVGLQSMADRYTYVPLTGLFIIVAWGVVDYAKNRNLGKILLWTASGIVLSALAVCTWHQVGYWQNSIKLFEHAIDVNPDDYKAHSGLAKTLRRNGDIDGAIKHFREAAKRLPVYSEPSENLVKMLLNKGISLGEQGRYDEAIRHFQEALSLRPDNIGVYYGLIVAYQSQNRFDEVIKYCQKALKISPNNKQIQQWLKQASEKTVTPLK